MTVNFILKMLSLLQAENITPKYNLRYNFTVDLNNSDQLCCSKMDFLDPGPGEEWGVQIIWRIVGMANALGNTL